jgi:hypothetical protein
MIKYVYCIAKKLPIEENFCSLDRCPEWEGNGGKCKIPYYIKEEKIESYLGQKIEKIDKYVTVCLAMPEHTLNELKSKTNEELIKDALMKVVYHYLYCPRA